MDDEEVNPYTSAFDDRTIYQQTFQKASTKWHILLSFFKMANNK